MPFKVKVDPSLCIGSASCTAIAPNTFDLDTEGKAIVKKKDGTTSKEFTNFTDIDDSPKNITYAAQGCPVNAIVIIEVDDKGKEIRQVWPT